MFKVLFLLTFMFLGFVLAHEVPSSGPLDHRNAHNCWINCEQEGLYHGEYHSHDK